MEGYHVAIASEAYAAYLFARTGFDVAVQYGANQPGYDLVISSDDRSLKVSVKGSQDGAWGLTQKFKKACVNYHEAIDLWVRSHSDQNIIYCFVQLYQSSISQCPNAYIVRICEVADALRRARNGEGDTVLWENHKFTHGKMAHTTSIISSDWRFSKERVDELFKRHL